MTKKTTPTWVKWYRIMWSDGVCMLVRYNLLPHEHRRWLERTPSLGGAIPLEEVLDLLAEKE